MGGFIFAIIIFIVGVGAVFVGRSTSRDPDANSVRWAAPAGVCVMIVAVIIVGFSCVNTVGARSVGIPITFGSIGSDLQPGVHILAPWTAVHSCPLGQQQSIMSDSPVSGDIQGHDGVNINGSDQGAAIADVSILYHFDPQHANLLYRKYGCDANLVKTNLIRQATRGGVAQAAAKIPSVDLRSNRAQIAQEALPVINSDFTNDGIVVDNIVISDIILSSSVQTAADAKLAAQQSAAQAEFVRQKAVTDALTAKVNADAAATANNSKSASLTPNVLCQNWIDAMRDIKPTTILSAGPCGGTSNGGVILQVPAK